jgi:hypothetical protein
MESSMVRHHPKTLLILPWTEPDKWVFDNHLRGRIIDVCSVPELHTNRSFINLFRCSLRIARQVKTDDCMVSWEATSAITTWLGIKVSGHRGKHIALGIIPKSTHKPLNAVLSKALSHAAIVTCFSKADVLTVNNTLGTSAAAVTPTVWMQSDGVTCEHKQDWLSVGASNRDDNTLARAAEASNIKVNRFARQQTHASAALDWHINADQHVVNHAFLSHRYHLAILETSRYASGLSIAVRAGFAGQLLIASDTPHMRDVILDGETGILVRLNDSEHLIEIIGLLTSGKIDSTKMSAAHKEYCREHHSYDVLRKHIEALVASCV